VLRAEDPRINISIVVAPGLDPSRIDKDDAVDNQMVTSRRKKDNHISTLNFLRPAGHYLKSIRSL